MSKSDPTKPKRLAIIASKGSLDWAYPPFILGSTAAAMGWEVGIFFTFFGLSLLKPKLNMSVTPLGNPAMPMKMPFGPKWFQNVVWPIPVFMMSIPGFQWLATKLMKMTFKNSNVATVEELRDICIQFGARLIACQMTMDVFGFKREEFIPTAEVAGAAAFLEYAGDADVTLYV
ncbi:MAG TPA: DsrE/DsrF/DrsH-like family protein [Anaerolineales bacterium]|nr:DsrE/DsrF/DrsH-like family protein [Anaerolineales bacterium]